VFGRDGRGRPLPGPGQESVWDYPRPPVIVADHRRVEVYLRGVRLCASDHSLRVLETASPPTFYLPAQSVAREYLVPSPRRTVCEWKGVASYFDARAGGVVVREAGWRYDAPLAGFEAIAGWYAFYPERLECFVAGERVRAQGGGFYGGWVTGEILGPFKGAQGTGGW